MARISKTQERFGKHPLAKAIEPIVEKWANDGYPAVNGKQITQTTRDLLAWWSSDTLHGTQFYLCQRRAIETIIYCCEILEAPLVKGLFDLFSEYLLENKNLEEGIEKITHPRFAIKMATGTGKTWVITALIVWSYWNKVRYGDKRFPAHFLLCAPGNIVYERLLDSFLGKKLPDGKRDVSTADIKLNLMMPDDWRQEFNLRVFTKEDLQETAPITDDPFILITNWHQLSDTTTEQGEETLAENLGIDATEKTASLRAQRFFDFLTYNKDLLVLNDEAHHVQNATDSEEKKWQEALEKIKTEIHKDKESTFIQLDFTATPFVIKGKQKQFFPHVVYDYGLIEAMRNLLVKQIFIEKSSLLSSKIEKLPADELDIIGHRDAAGIPIELSETQKHMVDVGLAKLEKLQEEFEKLKISKKPVMFVVADQNAEADLVSEYIKQKTDRNGISYGNDAVGEQVVTIHEGRKNKLSDDDYEKLRNTVFRSDDITNPTRIIVSVLMLREGFDVRNVCVLVVLRRSDSDLLTEQIIGRGIRLMFGPEYLEDKQDNYSHIQRKEPLINSYDLLFIVEHPKYNEIYTQLTEAGAIIAAGSSLDLNLDSKSILIEIDESRLDKLDLAWPISISFRNEEQIDFNGFDVSALRQYPKSLDDIHATRILITDYHPDTKFRQEWELTETDFSYGAFLRNVTKSIIGTSARNVWLSRYFSDITGIVDEYVTSVLFGRTIDFQTSSEVFRLRNQELFDFVVIEIRKKLSDFIQKARNSEVVEADWTRLSQFRNMRVKMERSINTTKCLYPVIDFPPRGGFERAFTENSLENDSFVDAYVKLNMYIHKFSVIYRDSRGFLVPYYPDFIVKTKDFMLIVETKSEKDARSDIDVKTKAMSAEQMCKIVSNIKTPAPILQPRMWKYILLPQNVYKEMEGQGLKAIIDRCESYLANLKLQREN